MSFVRPLETGLVLNKMHIKWNISFKMPYFKVPDFLHYWRTRKYVPRNITEHYHSEDSGFSIDVSVLNIFSLADFRCEFSGPKFYTGVKLILGTALLGLIHFTC